MTDGQSESSRALDETSGRVSQRLTLGDSVRWHDGRQHHVGHRVRSVNFGGRSLVVSFGELWLVPTEWLRPLEARNDADRGQLSLWDDECEGMCGV